MLYKEWILILRSLVTGANGFVGSALCGSLNSRGDEVFGCSRIASSLKSCSRSFQISTLNSDTDWSEALNRVETIYHLAARVHVTNDHSVNQFAKFFEINYRGTSRLASQAADAGVKRFIYVSSVKVIGENTLDESFVESTETSPADSYAISKHEAEKFLLNFSKETDMQIVIVRPPLIYGPGVKANFLNLLKLVNTGIPLPLAAVNNKRSLIYLGNLVDALIQCALHPKAAGNTYLVSDGQDVSTPELIRYIADSLKTPARLLNVPLPWMSFIAKLLGKSSSVERLTQSLVIDSSKIRNELGWSPPYTLEQGLAATAAWFKENY